MKHRRQFNEAERPRRVSERVWRRILVGDDDECWLWLGKRAKGYGQFMHDGRMVYVHRFVYTERVGPIPRGLFVCHACDVRHCCNPRHLFTGTAQENAADMVDKGRWRGSRGDSPSPRAKLDVSSVLDIWASRPKPARLVAEQYGVSASCVHKIRTRATWASVLPS
jgi:hypothetical protein